MEVKIVTLEPYIENKTSELQEIMSTIEKKKEEISTNKDDKKFTLEKEFMFLRREDLGRIYVTFVTWN